MPAHAGDAQGLDQPVQIVVLRPADGGGETGDPVAAANALNASGAPLFQEAGFPEEVYLGVIVSTPRQAEAVGYLAYLMSETPSAS